MIVEIEKRLNNKLIVFAAIAAVSLIAYANSFTVPFLLDDFGSIVNSYSIRNPMDLAAIWNFYANRFILYFSFSLNYVIHSTSVEGYHITNVALHIFNGFLVYLIIYNILSLKHFEEKIYGKFKNLICSLCGIMFVSHPLQVNAVTYIVQRTASLAAAFYFLAILFYLKFRVQSKLKYYILTAFFTIAAMFTKENTITIPFMLILIEIMFFNNTTETSWKKRFLFLFILLLTVPIIPATNVFLKGYSQSDPDVSFKASTSMDRFHYFYTQLNVILLYIKLMFVPYNQNFDYSNDFPISKTIWENSSYISLVIILIIGLFALVNLKKNKLLSFGILWFFIGLSVESSFISIKDVYFEHRLYFPIAGFIIFLIGAVFFESGKREESFLISRPIVVFLIISSIFIPVYMGLTLHRNYIYSDEIRLWTDTVKKAPKSDRAHSCLATSYLNAYEENKEKNKTYLDAAENEFTKAIELNYDNSTAHCNLAKVYLLKEEYQKCIDEANKTNKISKSKYAYYNLGSAYKKLGKTDDAIKAFNEGYNLDKKCTFILKALGNIYYENKDNTNARFYFKEYLKNITSPDKEINKKLEELS